MSETSVDLVEVRCPVGPRRLFTKLRLDPLSVRYLQPENWIEMSCADCRSHLRRQGHEVTHVLHRYAFTGALVQTVLAYGDGREEVVAGPDPVDETPAATATPADSGGNPSPPRRAEGSRP